MLISSVIENGDIHAALGQGVTHEWFVDLADEWKWLAGQYRLNREVPSKELFRTRFDEVQLRGTTPGETGAYAETLKEEHVSRRAVQIIKKARDSLRDGDEPSAVLDAMQGEARNVRMQSEFGDHSASVLMDDTTALDEFREELKATLVGNIPGISTGFPTLDKATYGFRPGEFWIVAGRLGQGKTYSLVGMSTAVIESGKKALYVSLEQPKNQIRNRAYSLLDHRIMQEESFKSIERRVKAIKNRVRKGTYGELIVDDIGRGKASPTYIATLVERHTPAVVFVDYLTLMAKVAGDWTQIAAISSELKGIAMHYDIPVVTAAQLNRNASEFDTPDARHIAGSDAIGQDADAVVTLKKESKRLIRYMLVKYRHGEDQIAWMTHFDPSAGMLKEVTKAEARKIDNEDKGLV